MVGNKGPCGGCGRSPEHAGRPSKGAVCPVLSRKVPSPADPVPLGLQFLLYSLEDNREKCNMTLRLDLLVKAHIHRQQASHSSILRRRTKWNVLKLKGKMEEERKNYKSKKLINERARRNSKEEVFITQLPLSTSFPSPRKQLQQLTKMPELSNR